MISEKLLASLNLKSKKLIEKNKDLIDIVLYGSIVKGRESLTDIDLMLIFFKRSLKERSDIAYEFKSSLEIENIDVKTMNLEDFFNTEFLARQGLLTEGISLVDNKNLSERFGFNSFALFSYSLKNLSHNEKVKFNYALNGRTTIGVLKRLEGKGIGLAVLLIPIKNKSIFEDFLKKWNVKYEAKEVLMPFYK